MERRLRFPELSVLSPKFDPDLEAVQCRHCWHMFSVAWNPNEYSYAVGEPLDPILESEACAPCLADIRSWHERHAPTAGADATAHPPADSGTGGVRLRFLHDGRTVRH